MEIQMKEVLKRVMTAIEVLVGGGSESSKDKKE